MIAMLLTTPVVLALATTPVPPPEAYPADAHTSPMTYAQAIASARLAAQDQRWSDAATDLAHARTLVERPDPVLAYDQAVAAYRAGDLTQAAQAFEAAMKAPDAELAADAAYNLGNTAYRAATESPESAPQADQQMQAAKDGLIKALEHFRSAIARDPDDEDARANGELTWQRLKEIEQQQQEQQQQQQQDQEHQSQDDQQQQDQEQQDQQQQQQQDQQQQSEDQQQQQDQEQQSQDDQQQQDQEQQDQQQQDQQQQDQQQSQDEQQQQDQQQQSQDEEQQQDQQQQSQDEQQQDSSPEPNASNATPRSPSQMSPEDAQRKLQAVRDRERQRRAERAEQEAAGRPSTGKDW